MLSILSVLLGSWLAYRAGRWVRRDARACGQRLLDRTRARVASIQADRNAPRLQRILVVLGTWIVALVRTDNRAMDKLQRVLASGVRWGWAKGTELIEVRRETKHVLIEHALAEAQPNPEPEDEILIPSQFEASGRV